MIEQHEWSEEPNKIQVAVLGSAGDTKRIWDKNNPDEVEDAERSFNEFRRKGYNAFHVSKDGSRGEMMREFDPNAERMIMVPQMQGG